MSKNAPSQVKTTIRPKTRIAIVAARFNEQIVDALLSACQGRLAELGVKPMKVTVERVPGAFELPAAAQALAHTGKYEAVICLGCVIRGDTPHFEYVAGNCAAGIARVALDEKLPVIFGVLTTNTLEQAQARTGAPGSDHPHAGTSAAEAAVEMIALVQRVSKK